MYKQIKRSKEKMESNVFYYNDENTSYPCKEEGFNQAIKDQIMWQSSQEKTFEQIREELFESINYSYEYIRGMFICLNPFQYDVHNSFTFLVCNSEEELDEAYQKSCDDI
jgi:hypothetical protein